MNIIKIHLLNEIFFCHDRVVKIKSWNFSIAKVWSCLGFYIDLPGVVIWQHIDPFTLHSYWEESLTRFQLPKILLRLWPSVLSLELIKCRSPCPTLVLKKLNMLIRIIGGFTGNYIESPFNSRKVTGEGWPDYADDGYAFVILINWSICCKQDNSSYPGIKSL